MAAVQKGPASGGPRVVLRAEPAPRAHTERELPVAALPSEPPSAALTFTHEVNAAGI
jgi:hypothetical protein